jgi:hypothetical protein
LESTDIQQQRAGRPRSQGKRAFFGTVIVDLTQHEIKRALSAAWLSRKEKGRIR